MHSVPLLISFVSAETVNLCAPMQPECFHVLEGQAARHWFFCGREAIVRSLLPKGTGLRVLDVGCGTGHLAARLANDGYSVVGLEPNPTAFSYAVRRIPEAIAGDAQRLPFPDASFDIVISTDVLEHVPDDAAAANEILRVLKPHGVAVLTVPALHILWCPQDVTLGHKRRYTKNMLRHVFVNGRVRKLSFYNTILFLPILFFRLLFRVAPKLAPRDEVEMTPVLFNGFFSFLLSIERRMLTCINLPIGVSLLIVVEKPTS